MSPHDAARGFDAVADSYDRSRPDYPMEAVDLLVRLLRLHPGRTLLDVGAGTGKLSRLVAARGARVVAVEPSAAMVRRAAGGGVVTVRGLAEALPVRAHAVDAACAASAFHWFDGRRALGEIHRVLCAGGGSALVWNQRDDEVAWVARLSALVNRHEGAAPRYRRGEWRAAFDSARDLFRPVEEAHFRHVHPLPPEGVVERIASISFVGSMDAPARAAVLDGGARAARGGIPTRRAAPSSRSPTAPTCSSGIGSGSSTALLGEPRLPPGEHPARELRRLEPRLPEQPHGGDRAVRGEADRDTGRSRSSARRARRDGSAEIGTFTAPRTCPRRNSISVRTSRSWGACVAPVGGEPARRDLGDLAERDPPRQAHPAMVADVARRVEVAYHPRTHAPDQRPLAFLLAAVIAIVARRPRLLVWVLVVFAVWFLIETVRGRRRRR